MSEPGADGALYVPLSRAGSRPEELDVFEHGAVVESRPYLLSATVEGGGLVRATCTVNGGDEHVYEPPGGPLPAHTGAVTVDFEPPASQPCPFSLVFGFARVEVALWRSDGTAERLFSQDIPCASSSGVRDRDIRGMLETLLEPGASGAREWMFSQPTPEPSSAGRHSLIEGGVRRRSARSLNSYLHMTDLALGVFEEQFSAVRVQANTRVSTAVEVVPAARIRRIGNQEIVWMSRHPEVMERSAAGTSVFSAGSYYRPHAVQTEKSVRSFSTYENRLLLSFLRAVLDDLSVISAQLRLAHADAERLASKLKRLERDDCQLGALVVAESYADRSARLSPRVDKLRARAQRLARMYGAALPDAVPERMAAPRRTRVFQEIAPYARLYAAMRRWWEDGEYALGQEGLALRLVRSDRLYELYTLFRLLDWLDKHGFSAREGEREPFGTVRYTVEDGRYEPEARVANVYMLSSADCSVDLYYEPVIHGNALEEHGITLHRTTGSQADPVYTPDFVLSVSRRDGSPRRTFVLDAKYSDPHLLRKPRDGADGPSEFGNCQRKYLLDTVDALTGRAPDALWLLSGKGSESEPWVFELSPWARSHMRPPGYALAFPSGIASVTPRTGSLDRLFAMMGLGSSAAVGQQAGGLPETKASSAEGRVPDGGLADAPAVDEAPPVPEEIARGERLPSGSAAAAYATPPEEGVREPEAPQGNSAPATPGSSAPGVCEAAAVDESAGAT